MITLPLKEEFRNKDWKIILNIALNNNSPYKIINDFKNQIQRNNSRHKTNNNENKKKWVTFTYHSPQIRKKNCCILLVNLFELYDDAQACQRQKAN